MLISILSSYVIHHSFTFHSISYIYTQSLWHSVLSSSVWVQVMFERGSTRKPKRKKKSDTAIYPSVTSLLCIMLLFPGMSTQLHPPDRQYSQNSSILRFVWKESGPGRRYAFSRPTRAASLWQGKGQTKAELAAGGRRKSQGCNPEQETCLSQQSKHRPSSAHSND